MTTLRTHRLHAGTAVGHGRRQDPGLPVERMARGISPRQRARPDPDRMDHRPGPAARKSAEHRRRTDRKSSNCRAATGSKTASLTGDCFMQAPFWKADGETQKSLVDDLDLVLASCSTLGIEFVVIPLVDNGRIESAAQTETLLRVLLDRAASLSKQGVKIVFESDLPPAPLAQFIDKFPREVFGINYDSGNSAALGYDSAEEISGLRAAHSQCARKGSPAWRHHRAARDGRCGSRQDHSADRAVRLSRAVYSSNRARHRRRPRRRAGTISRHDRTLDRGRQAMKLDIEDRVALVVGASRGIGFAIADTLAAEGAKVAMAARGHRRPQIGCRTGSAAAPRPMPPTSPIPPPRWRW